MIEGNVEYQLVAAGTPRGGWAGERPELSRDVEEACVRSIAGFLLQEREQEFRQHLRLIFSQMVEAEQLRQSYRLSALRKAMRQGQPRELGSGRVAKYVTAARESLKILSMDCRLIAGRGRVSHPTMVRFFRELKRDPAVFGVLCAASGMEQSRRLRLWFHPPSRRAAFIGLVKAISDANLALQRAAKPGGSDPIYEQLARALAGLYFHCTGRSPRRSYDAMATEDAGPLLRLCQIMARAIYDAQPDATKRRSVPKMAKTARRMMDEFDVELSADSARQAD